MKFILNNGEIRQYIKSKLTSSDNLLHLSRFARPDTKRLDTHLKMKIKII